MPDCSITGETLSDAVVHFFEEGWRLGIAIEATQVEALDAFMEMPEDVVAGYAARRGMSQELSVMAHNRLLSVN